MPHAAGIYWSSHIEELVKLLHDNAIAFQSEDDECLPADGVGRSEEIEQARQETERAKRQADDVSQKFLIWVILLGAVALAALILALKKPRQQIIHAQIISASASSQTNLPELFKNEHPKNCRNTV